MLADFFDGKEDEEAQKTIHTKRKPTAPTIVENRKRRRTEDVPREENEDLTGEESQPGHALHLKHRGKGTLQETCTKAQYVT